MLILALDQFLDKLVNLGSRDIGHDDDMSNVFFTCQLPSFNQGLVQGPLEDNGTRQIIQTTRETGIGNLVTQVASRFHAVTVSENKKRCKVSAKRC
jgi:hypothetical protein